MMDRRRACTQVLFLRKAELGFFHFLEIVIGWLVTFHRRRRSRLLKTGFFRQVRELKIRRKNPGIIALTPHYGWLNCSFSFSSTW
jgi:hypothetical protein